MSPGGGRGRRGRQRRRLRRGEDDRGKIRTTTTSKSNRCPLPRARLGVARRAERGPTRRRLRPKASRPSLRGRRRAPEALPPGAWLCSREEKMIIWKRSFEEEFFFLQKREKRVPPPFTGRNSRCSSSPRRPRPSPELPCSSFFLRLLSLGHPPSAHSSSRGGSRSSCLSGVGPRGCPRGPPGLPRPVGGGVDPRAASLRRPEAAAAVAAAVVVEGARLPGGGRSSRRRSRRRRQSPSRAALGSSRGREVDQDGPAGPRVAPAGVQDRRDGHEVRQQGPPGPPVGEERRGRSIASGRKVVCGGCGCGCSGVLSLSLSLDGGPFRSLLLLLLLLLLPTNSGRSSSDERGLPPRHRHSGDLFEKVIVGVAFVDKAAAARAPPPGLLPFSRRLDFGGEGGRGARREDRRAPRRRDGDGGAQSRDRGESALAATAVAVFFSVVVGGGVAASSTPRRHSASPSSRDQRPVQPGARPERAGARKRVHGGGSRCCCCSRRHRPLLPPARRRGRLALRRVQRGDEPGLDQSFPNRQARSPAVSVLALVLASVFVARGAGKRRAGRNSSAGRRRERVRLSLSRREKGAGGRG